MEIREAREDDATVLAELLGELGYPTAPEKLPQRLDRLRAEAGAGLIVAVPGSTAGRLRAPPAPTRRSDCSPSSSSSRSSARRRPDHLEVTAQPKREDALALYVGAGYAEEPRRLPRFLEG